MCECDNWCDTNAVPRLLTGHHENCIKSANALNKAIELIGDLVRGIEYWAKDCDGVHEKVWDAYVKGKALSGQVYFIKKK